MFLICKLGGGNNVVRARFLRTIIIIFLITLISTIYYRNSMGGCLGIDILRYSFLTITALAALLFYMYNVQCVVRKEPNN